MDEKKLKKVQAAVRLGVNPTDALLLQKLIDVEELAVKLEQLLSGIDTVKLEYIKGDDGYTPIKGTDYVDGEDGYTPIKGKDYFDGEDGKTPTKDELVALIKPLMEKPEQVDTTALVKQVLDQVEVPEIDQKGILDALAAQIPQLGMSVRDALELLPEGEKLLTSSIEDRDGKNLDIIIEELKKQTGKTVFAGGGARVANQISVDTTNFAGNLSAADDTVQKALETLDDAVTGSSAFIGLTDTPPSYTGQAGKFAKVKATEDGLEFGSGDGVGDMLKATYDPANKNEQVLTIGDATDFATAAQGALADSALQNIVEDTTPQLGGNLDTQGYIILGGTSTTADLTFQTTTGVGATGADMHFKVGNNGATEALTILNNGNIGIGTNAPTAKLDISAGNLDIDSTTFANQNGIITKDGTRFIHDFNYGNNGTVTTTGLNTFVGKNTGNFTMGSTATLTYHASYNTMIGDTAFLNNTTGHSNVGIGVNALRANTTGYYNMSLGTFSLYNNTTGNYNTAQGTQALYLNTSGNANSVQGYQSGYDNTTGANNTYLGYNTGRGITTGSNNTILGANVTGLSASLANNIIIADGQGNRRINVDSTGNVGIGTASPGSKLEVSGGLDGIYNSNVLISSSVSSAKLAFNPNGVSSAGIGSASGGLIFYASGANTERMRIDSAGNVGIGTTVNNVYDQVASGRPLVVQSSDSATTIGGSGNTLAIINGNTTTNNTSALMFGAITGASTNQYTDAGIVAIHGARTNGQYPTGQLAFLTSTSLNTAPTEKVRIDNNGNVGIGTTSPDYKLDINGALGLRATTTPSDPDSGAGVVYMDSSTGDLMTKLNFGGTTKTVIIVDWSAV